MKEIVDWIKADHVPAKCVLTVYDSIILEVREDCIDEVAHHVKNVMTQYEIGVPLVADAKVGRSCGTMSKYAFKD